jgi:hypothetical protein
MKRQLDVDNSFDDIRMKLISERHKIAIQNWQKIGIRVIVLRSLAFNIVDPETIPGENEPDQPKSKWYESGTYVIKPNTIYYLIWDVTKSVLYMVSIYTLAFAAAFKFEGDNGAESFEFFVDLIQLLDIIHVFFCATKIYQLSQLVQQIR